MRWRIWVAFYLSMILSTPAGVLAATLGYDQIGTTVTGVAISEVAGNVFTASGSFQAAGVCFHIQDSDFSDPYSAVAVYEVDGSGLPTNLLGYSDRNEDSHTYQWNYVPFLAPVNIVSGLNYFVCVQFDFHLTGLSTQSSAPAPCFHDTSNVFNAFSDPAVPLVQSDRTYSIYLTDIPPTPTSTHSPTGTRTATSTPTPTATPSVTPSRTMTTTPSATVSGTATGQATVTPLPTQTPTPSRTAEIPQPDWENKRVWIYPNPAKDMVYIQLPPHVSGECRFAIYNMVGQKVADISRQIRDGGTLTWQCGTVGVGVYLLKGRLTWEDGSSDYYREKIAVVK